MDDEERRGVDHFERVIQFHDEYERIQNTSEFLEHRLGKDVDPLLKNSYLLIYAPKQEREGFFFGIGTSLLKPKYFKQALSSNRETERKTSYSPFIVFMASIHQAMKRYASLREMVAPQLRRQEELFAGVPIQFSKQRNFSTSRFGGDLVTAPTHVLERIGSALETRNGVELRRVMSAIGSLFFHETLHRLTDEEGLNTDAYEEITLLGEFLYDPKENTERNKVFNKYTEMAFGLEQNGEKVEGLNEYQRFWKRLAIPILLKELVERGEILPPENPTEFKTAALELPHHYTRLSEEERMKVLAKYAVMQRSQLYRAGKDAIEKMSLRYETNAQER